MKKYFPAAVIIITLILAVFFYRSAFSGYFFQDDWFSFKISQIHSMSDFLNLFIPRTDVIYYRPAGMQLPFLFMHALFGLRALPYHVLIFVTHAINIILVYFLVNKLGGNKASAGLCAFMYGVSTVHYIPFYWFATYSFILGPTFFFLTFIFFLKYLDAKNNFFMYCYLIFYILGIFTNEIVVMLFPILFIFGCINFRKYKHSLIKPLIYGGIGTLFLLGIRIVYKPPVSGLYAINIGKHILNNLQAYIIWSFNWPEEMKAQFISFYKVNPEFIKNFGNYFYIFTGTFIILVSLLFVFPILKYIHTKKRNNLNNILFGMGWFVLGLIPVLLFPTHSFAYYLPISLAGLLLSASLLMQTTWNTYNTGSYLRYIYIISIVFSWCLSAFATVEFNAKVHWAPRRSQIAKTYMLKAKANYPRGYNGEYIFVVKPSSESKLALNDQDGFQVIFDNPQIMTVYGYQEGKESL